jgi:phosphatidylglycerophosphate synthase
MFVREFLVTALRSAYERRAVSMKTSYLGKVKTWTQMQGIGMLVLLQVIGASDVLTGILIAGLVAPLVAMALLWIIKKKLWKGALVMSGSFVALLAVYLQDDPRLTRHFIMFLVVAITWVSGFDYLVGGVKHLRGRGDFGRADAVRILGALAIPVLVFLVMIETPAYAWPLLTILSMELAVGGLDNLLSHHQHASGALPWGARVGGVSALLGAGLALPDYAGYLAVLAAALSTAGVAWEFWRGRDYYLDARLRDKAPPERARRAELRPQGS